MIMMMMMMYLVSKKLGAHEDEVKRRAAVMECS
jgi:hypothetical protein